MVASGPRQAFVLRIAPGGIDRVDEALRDNVAIIGWAMAAELCDSTLGWSHFREVLFRRYYTANPKGAGQAAGHMWRFLREMKRGDLIVTPHGSGFYVGRIEGEPKYVPEKANDGTAFRRPVLWLNDKGPIPRSTARAALQSRMKAQGTCVSATDLLTEIDDCVQVSQRGQRPSFGSDLHARLVRETLDEIRSGRIENFGLETLVQAVLIGLGAREAPIIPRSQDKGADIVATFVVAGAFELRIAVQAKHFQPNPPVGADVVQQLISGIEAESASLGMIVTSGAISEEAVAAAESYFEQKGVRIELVDGPQMATLIVEHGLRAP